MRLSEIENPKSEAKSKIPTAEELAGLKDAARMKSVEELSGLEEMPVDR